MLCKTINDKKKERKENTKNLNQKLYRSFRGRFLLSFCITKLHNRRFQVSSSIIFTFILKLIELIYEVASFVKTVL